MPALVPWVKKLSRPAEEVTIGTVQDGSGVNSVVSAKVSWFALVLLLYCRGRIAGATGVVIVVENSMGLGKYDVNDTRRQVEKT